MGILALETEDNTGYCRTYCIGVLGKAGGQVWGERASTIKPIGWEPLWLRSLARLVQTVKEKRLLKSEQKYNELTYGMYFQLQIVGNSPVNRDRKSDGRP